MLEWRGITGNLGLEMYLWCLANWKIARWLKGQSMFCPTLGLGGGLFCSSGEVCDPSEIALQIGKIQSHGESGFDIALCCMLLAVKLNCP